MNKSIEDVRGYWDSHLNLSQFLDGEELDIGSPEFYERLEQVMGRFGYKERFFREAAERAPGLQLLEVGCGLGLELAKLARLGFQVTGLDLAPSAVAFCNEHLKRQGLGGEAVVGNAEQMDFPDESFDVVYSSGVIQHTPSIERAIAEIRRVLRPAGRILIVLYHRRSWFYLLHRLSGTNIEFPDRDAPIINAYTKKELRTLFRHFRDIRVDCAQYRAHRTNRGGLAAVLYNGVFVPVANVVPAALIRGLGWHLVLTAAK